ncbi:MAG TPA: sodium-dependent bicarbonate transport family permease, partial [Limnochorda sp.]
ENLLSPMILFFALGLVAGSLRSELVVPKGLVAAASLYLLMAIGFRGGAELAQEGLSGRFVATAGAGLLLGLVVLPCTAFAILTKLGQLDPVNAGAIASHYGSISVVTFVTAAGFLFRQGLSHEGFMTAVMALMEAPGVIGGILLARRYGRQPGESAAGTTRAAVRETLLGGGPTVLAGSLVVGMLAGDEGRRLMEPFVTELFPGALSLFLLEMGLTAGRQVGEFLRVGRFLAAFGVAMPLIGGSLGALLGSLIGLSVGGTTLFAALAASASYIAAPAAVRLALPQANPALAITLALGVTFPFNVLLGIPLYHTLASWLHRY